MAPLVTDADATLFMRLAVILLAGERTGNA
jgi:hypothetical protein